MFRMTGSVKALLALLAVFDERGEGGGTFEGDTMGLKLTCKSRDKTLFMTILYAQAQRMKSRCHGKSGIP